MENLQELTECCICTENFTDARMLPCIHTFCLKCLQQTATKNEIKVGEKMPCPFCRREFVIPTAGMSGLQKNFFISRLVEITQLSKPVEKATSCEICIEDKETEACEMPTATNYCIQCRRNICNLCCRYHRRVPDLIGHELLPLGCEMKDELFRKYADQSCDKHIKEKAKLFCSDCKEVFCIMCFVENHQLHKCTDIESSADSFRKQILDTIERVSSFSTGAALKSETRVKEKSEFLKKVEREETAVVTTVEILKELVDKCAQPLLDELNSIKLSHLKELETAKEENEFHTGILESFKEYCRELTSKGSSSEICRSALNINLREVELKQMHMIYSERQITPVEFSFEASNLEELLKTENVVGKIKVEKKSVAEERIAKATEGSEDGQDEVSILSSVELGLPSVYVNRVTKLLQRIYILSSYCNSIYVFADQNPFLFQKEIKINAIKNPRDIEANEESKCLYITDVNNNCIWQITSDDHQVTKWMSTENQPLTLSASNDSQLVILTKDQASRYYVEIYKSDTKFICRLLLPVDIHRPSHVIQTTNGEFIISHRSGRDRRWVISRLKSDCQKIINQFNPTDDRESYPWFFTCYISSESDKNRLIAASYYKVILLDSNSLNLIKILLTQKGCGSQSLHYDAKKRQLIVAQSSGKVNIYEIN